MSHRWSAVFSDYMKAQLLHVSHKESFSKDIETCTSSHTLHVGFLLGERCQTQECRIFGDIESNVEINAQTAARPCLLVRPK